MKYLIYLIALTSLSLYSQNKYLTKSGIVNFEASVPSFEEVKASNSSVTAILNTENGEFAALVLVKGFRFKNALMEEHFNENYAESNHYPKATYKGRIKDFSIEKLKSMSDFKIDGELTFHGKTKLLESVPIIIKKDGNTIGLSGNFKAIASDFDIKIPKIVQNKVSESVNVSFVFTLKSK